ncbi:MAG: hypothetical protein IKP66_07460, partial [Lachnospiraceae bacterium]|nr:hypothetical protein [Lachnospiraceae bacterium]
IHHLDILDDYGNSGNKLPIYNFNNTIKLGEANTKTFVGDDCSCFAAAVYWYYLNQLDDAKDIDKIDLWTTGSSKYISKSKETNKPNILDILINNDFEIYQWDDTEKNIDDDYNIKVNLNFKLQPGDLLYRSNGKNGASAHVEFYLDDKHSFVWGEIHSSYENENESKHFKIIRNLDIYNIGKTVTADKALDGDTYRIDEECKSGIYNTIYRSTDYNCRYDYVIRIEQKKAED